MFSGIVEATATIAEIVDGHESRRMRLEAVTLGPELGLGDSVSVDGACLTVAELASDGFVVDVIGTTLERTIAGRYVVGSRVNLERAMKLGHRLDGHLVQGHVDGIGEVRNHVQSGDYWLLDVEIPSDVHAQTIEHGSLTLNGVSLTVSELLEESGVRIGVIPHTHEHTNLGALRRGDAVNVEGDMIGKYVARLLRGGGSRPAAPTRDPE